MLTLTPTNETLSGMRDPRYHNGPDRAEGKFYDLLTAQGWTVTKKGWPDFACYKQGRLILVEVKAHHGRRLKREQIRLMTALAANGVDCFRWSPDHGFERILPPTEKP